MSVTAAQGFRAIGLAAGIKASGKPDVALIVNDGPRDHAAAVFTSNRFPAAPVLWSRQAVSDGSARAVIVNSGGANACTGAQGFQDAHAMAEATSHRLTEAGTEIGAGDVLVCSTGLIGELLPMDKVHAGIDECVAALTYDGGESAALAFMTTDSVPKLAVRQGERIRDRRHG
jgi:N-acetylglutamate synthase (N-acetylornithine aminotransferase)